MSERCAYLRNVGILLVDPSEFMRGMLVHLLRVFGCEDVRTAADGAAALGEVEHWIPDLTLTEIVMPGMDGFELTRALRRGKDSPDPYLPIIACTAYTERANVLRARDAGVTEFVTKPISARSLFAHINEVVEHPRPFVRTRSFFGPDRRRRGAGGYRGDERRRGARAPGPAADDTSQEAIDQVIAGEAIHSRWGAHSG